MQCQREIYSVNRNMQHQRCRYGASKETWDFVERLGQSTRGRKRQRETCHDEETDMEFQ